MSEAKQKRVDDIALAINAACGAIQCIAGKLAISQNTFTFLATKEGDDGFNVSRSLAVKQRNALQRALKQLDRVMEDLGNFVTNGDGVEPIDEVATDGAYRLVHHVLYGTPLEDNELQSEQRGTP